MSDESGNRDYEVPKQDIPQGFRIGNVQPNHPSNSRNTLKQPVVEGENLIPFPGEPPKKA